MNITEQNIEETLLKLDGVSKVEQVLLDLTNQAPELAAFLFSDESSILTENEQQLYSYLIAFYWVLFGVYFDQAPRDMSIIETFVEDNWALILNRGRKSFRQTLDPIFKDFPEIEALAFLEDNLTLDDNDYLTIPGRDYIFVMIKSLLDLFISFRW